MLIKRIKIAILGLFREPAAQMIYRDDAIVAAQVFHKSPPREAPCGIAMHHQQHRPLPFVDIMLHMPVHFEPVRRKRILLLKPVTAIRALTQFRIDLLRCEQAGDGLR